MPALNYMKRMAPLVESGAKRQTIRKRRADGRDPKKGQVLYQYTGQRTKACRKLREDICISSELILIDENEVVVAGRLLTPDEEHELALLDGFKSASDFRAFFLDDYIKQFEGYLIKWG